VERREYFVARIEREPFLSSGLSLSLFFGHVLMSADLIPLPPAEFKVRGPRRGLKEGILSGKFRVQGEYLGKKL